MSSLEVAEETSQTVKPYTSREKTLAWSNALAFIVTIVFNALSSTGSISPYAIGEISDYWNTKFTPAGNAFSIWGLIYFGLAVFVLLPVVPSSLKCSANILHADFARKVVFEDIGYLFLVSCVCNIIWILLFIWRTVPTVWLSVPMLFGLMISLELLLRRAQIWREPRSSYLEYFAIDFTFSVYAGWATVASIVNLSAALVASGWDGSPWTEAGWSVLLMVVAAIINLLMIYREENAVHALVYVWAVYWIGVANNTDKTIYLPAYILAIFVLVISVLKICLQIKNSWQKKEAVPQDSPAAHNI